ncbi:hypothetical protein ASPZODRAFT_70603 [Penicilliopsis zonata CBS 506.65]|uniref:NodB homology domain-containing protein n=1 Tax=Penicilliopsis zonata CBS 506.65 TaxID=1073090 RepID=A0A1L9SCS3_9EURO|nr:hypothetical protein ASPZODRAFT_70603 [Penicilliopsis zonata CBS 506.65]OJJ44929.1 hypothetical protein ASPZODRAFT_70603 [Penicilliopsis zonata CBS 506.65]
MHLQALLGLSSLALAAIVSACGLEGSEHHHITIRDRSRDENEIQDDKFVTRGFKPRCGPEIGKCSDGYCCSSAGFCGDTQEHCKSPDCLMDYGRCDAHKRPKGPPTSTIPRPKIGNVLYGPSIIRSCNVPGTVALTYDDGPYKYTQDLLDLLDRYDAKATFFITGVNNGKGQIDDLNLPWASLIKDMYLKGHQVASHTWSHQNLTRITSDQRREQILRNEAAIRNIIGVFPTYMRPPFSSCDIASNCLDDMGSFGYHVVLYDLDTQDYRNANPEAIQQSKDIFDRELSYWKVSEKSWLVIGHDIQEQTVYNLTEHMLRRLTDDGYRAVTVGDCLSDPRENWYRKDNRIISGPNDKTPKAPPAGNKPVSTDGTCGANHTCIKSNFGPCCSSHHFCGNSTQHCGVGCLPDAGYCFSPNTTTLNITDSLGGAVNTESKISAAHSIYGATSKAGSLVGNPALTLGRPLSMAIVTALVGAMLFEL